MAERESFWQSIRPGGSRSLPNVLGRLFNRNQQQQKPPSRFQRFFKDISPGGSRSIPALVENMFTPRATPPGQYGPMMNNYPNLPQTQNTGPSYDKDYSSNLVSGYLNADPRTGGMRTQGSNAGMWASAASGGIASAMASRMMGMRPTDNAAHKRNKNSNMQTEDKV